MLLKKSVLLGFSLAVASLPLSAHLHMLKAPTLSTKGTATTAASSTLSVYYHTPEGVTFVGMDKQGNLVDDYAFAPAGKWLESLAEVKPSNAKFTWTYPTGKDADGNETLTTDSYDDLRFRIKEEGLYSAPVLTATSGDNSASYTMAADGIYFGEYGTWDNFAVNYQPGQTSLIDHMHDILSTNDPTATTYLNMVMNDGIFSDIKVQGFGESFYDCGDFYLEAINAMVYSPQTLTEADIAVKVFFREKTKVDYDNEVAQLTTVEVTPLGNNRYYVLFKPEKPVFIEGAMQVVVLAPEGSSSRFSPLVPAQKYYSGTNMGTASLYSTFKFMGGSAPLQCLDFFGAELSDDNDKTLGYLNNWAFGVKGSYTEPASAIHDIKADAIGANQDTSVYNLKGIKVAESTDNLNELPQGIYITGGKKILKR